MALTRRPGTGDNRPRNDDMPTPRRKPAIVIAVGAKKSPVRRTANRHAARSQNGTG